MQGRTVMNGMDLKAYLGRLRQNPKYTEEIVKLIEEDLRFGLTKEEIEEYSGGKYDYRQMRVYSRCLRNGYGREEKEVILKDGLSGEQMAVALEFYEKGVPLDSISKILSDGEHTAYAMKRLFSQVLHRIKETEPIREQDMVYAKELMEQIREVVAKISYQEERYDALNEKLKEIGTTGQDAQIQNNLLIQLSEKDALLEQQQDELNEARAEIARLRGEIEEIQKEKVALEVQAKKADYVKEAVNMLPESKSESEMLEREKVQEIPIEKNRHERTSYSGGEYQTAVVDKDGSVIRFITVESMERKDGRNRAVSMFSRLFPKKKMDLIKLLAEKDLSPEQLTKVRSAIERGLSEKQLLVLINNRIPAEQMEEIINIAIYENKMKEE